MNANRVVYRGVNANRVVYRGVNANMVVYRGVNETGLYIEVQTPHYSLH